MPNDSNSPQFILLAFQCLDLASVHRMEQWRTQDRRFRLCSRNLEQASIQQMHIDSLASRKRLSCGMKITTRLSRCGGTGYFWTTFVGFVWETHWFQGQLLWYGLTKCLGAV
jgi:hypothetical protein